MDNNESKKKGILLLGIGGLAGLISAGLVYFAVSAFSPTEAVLVAAADLQPGDPITADKVKTEYKPQSGLPGDVLRAGEDLTATIASQGMTTDDMLRSSKVTKLNGQSPSLLSARLLANNVNLKAVEIPTDSINGMLAGMKAGDKIDIVSTFKINQGEYSSATIIHGAPVIGVQPPGDKPGVLIIGVTEEQSQALATARENGKIYPALLPFGK